MLAKVGPKITLGVDGSPVSFTFSNVSQADKLTEAINQATTKANEALLSIETSKKEEELSEETKAKDKAKHDYELTKLRGAIKKQEAAITDKKAEISELETYIGELKNTPPPGAIDAAEALKERIKTQVASLRLEMSGLLAMELELVKMNKRLEWLEKGFQLDE